MKVAVFGGGAVGLGLASCLLAAAERVHLHVRRAEVAERLSSHGLRRTGLFGDAIAAPDSFEVATELAALAAFDPDFVLVCTKNPERAEAARELGQIWPRLPAEPAVVTCLNGWGGAEELARRIPQDRVFSATVTTGFRRVDANHVEVTVHGDDVRMGSLFGGPQSQLAPLCSALTKGGLPSTLTDDMQSELWAKLLYNCALNPLAALLGVPYGAVGEDPKSNL